MSSSLALGPVAAAILAALQADSGVLALVPVGRILDDAPPRPVFPYILVEASGEVPFNTMGAPAATKYGSSTRVTVRVLSQFRGDQEVCTVMSAVKAVIDGQRLTIAGYPGTPIATFVTGALLKDTINGVVTRELVADFDVTVHQQN